MLPPNCLAPLQPQARAERPACASTAEVLHYQIRKCCSIRHQLVRHSPTRVPSAAVTRGWASRQPTGGGAATTSSARSNGSATVSPLHKQRTRAITDRNSLIRLVGAVLASVEEHRLFADVAMDDRDR